MTSKLDVVDFSMFMEAIRPLATVVDGIKVTVGPDQTKILAKNSVSRLKITTNSLTAKEETVFCTNEVGKFVKMLELVHRQAGKNDKIVIEVNETFIKIKCKAVKSKFALVREDVVLLNVDKEFAGTLNEVVRFKTSTGMINELNKSSFIFNDATTARIYILADEQNPAKLKATLGNRSNPFSNEVTFNFGNIQSGTIEKEIILNFTRLNMFTLLSGVDDIEMVLPDMNALYSTQKIEKDDVFVKMVIISSIMAV